MTIARVIYNRCDYDRTFRENQIGCTGGRRNNDIRRRSRGRIRYVKLSR